MTKFIRDLVYPAKFSARVMKKAKQIRGCDPACVNVLKVQREERLFVPGQSFVQLRIPRAKELAPSVVGPVAAEYDCQGKTGWSPSYDDDFVMFGCRQE